MNSDFDPNSQYRANLLTVMLAVLVGGGCLMGLTVLTNGMVLVVPVVLAVLAPFVLLHYWLWGKSFSDHTEGEREEAQSRMEAELNEWDMPNPRHRRRS